MKKTYFLGQTQSEIREFPKEVKSEIGFSIAIAQIGDRAINTTPLVGFGGAGVLEVISDHDGDTYRAVYTVRFENVVYILHAFKKKSVRGIETPKKEIDLVRRRLKAAEAHYLSQTKTTKKEEPRRKTGAT